MRGSAAGERWLTASFVLALVPLCLATALCVVWTRADRLTLGGDEPHYLIMARSVARDHDLNLRNDYEEDAVTGEIYGPVEPHAYRGEAAWPPYHSPGLGLLAAYPHHYGGIDAVRLSLLALSALIPVAIFAGLGSALSGVGRVQLSAALALSIPLSYGAFRVYPDLPAAAILVAVVVPAVRWWRSAAAPPLGSWMLMWTLAGLLPWLQSRFLAPWLLLVGGGVAIALRASAEKRARLLVGLLPALAGVALLLALNQELYGRLLGPPRWGELTTSPARAAMIFLGLHFDQSQGLFVQQPLWLAGLAALVPYARAHRREAAWLALLYLATVVPPAMQMGRFGGEGAIGRYAWAASFLWVVPLTFLAAECGPVGAAWCRRALSAAVAWQVFLAARWIAMPDWLTPTLDERIWARESLVPAQLRYVMPSFYFWDFAGYWQHPPNLVAIAGALLLVGAGAAHWSPSRLVVRRAWIGWLVAAGVLLPASSERDGSAEESRRISDAAVRIESAASRRFEAERLPPNSAGWQTHVDPLASNGAARRSVAAVPQGDSAPPVVFGPYVSLSEGNYAVMVAVGAPAAERHAGELAVIRVTARRGRDTLAERALVPADLVHGRYVPLRIPLTLAARADDVEVTITRRGTAEFWVDYVEFAPLLP